MDRQLTKRGVAGAERLIDIAGEDSGQIFSASVASVEDLLSAAREVAAADADRCCQDEHRRKADRQLALTHRRKR